MNIGGLAEITSWFRDEAKQHSSDWKFCASCESYNNRNRVACMQDGDDDA